MVCLAFAFCAPPPEPEPEAEEAPSTEADVAAINEVIRQWEDALNAGDLDRCGAMQADGAIWMPPNGAAIVGKEAILASIQLSFDQSVPEYVFSSEEVEVAGDWAFDRGTYKATITPKAEGEATQDVGKYLDIFQRQSDGSWKYLYGIWNSDNPPPE
jgi:uncharacterized protein (TIGR02246 family)